MIRLDVLKKGGYIVCYQRYCAVRAAGCANVCYANREEALKGIKEFCGYPLKIMEYPGENNPGRRIKLADLEAPENE